MTEQEQKIIESKISNFQSKFDKHVGLMCECEALRRSILRRKHKDARRLLIKVATYFRTGVDNADLEFVNIEVNEAYDELRVTFNRNPDDKLLSHDYILFEGKKSELVDWAQNSFHCYNASKELAKLGVFVQTP